MKILSIEPSVEIVVVSDYAAFPVYRRMSDGTWERLVHSGWRSVLRDPKELEAALLTFNISEEVE